MCEERGASDRSQEQCTLVPRALASDRHVAGEMLDQCAVRIDKTFVILQVKRQAPTPAEVTFDRAAGFDVEKTDGHWSVHFSVIGWIRRHL